jgi:hypothetical protein
MNADPQQGNSPDQPVEQLLAHWRRLGEHCTRELLQTPFAGDGQARARLIRRLLELGAWRQARALVLVWLLEWLETLPAQGRPDRNAALELWRCLADVCERGQDDQLLELFWQGLGRLRPAPPPPGVLPLMGVPVLNGPDHLLRLLASLDVPIGILAIVDQSGSREDPQSRRLRRELRQLERQGLPGVERVCLARPFGNAGVAAAWNQILLAFPQAPLALIVNHDVVFPAGVLAEALRRLDPGEAQYLALFPGDRAFSAFALTALAWDAVGRFDERYYPAYCEDLDYRDRLLATPAVQRLDGSFAHARMLACNAQHSCTLADDPALAEANAISFQLNRLWYYCRRRGPGSGGQNAGLWRQRWLGAWD